MTRLRMDGLGHVRAHVRVPSWWHGGARSLRAKEGA